MRRNRTVYVGVDSRSSRHTSATGVVVHRTSHCAYRSASHRDLAWSPHTYQTRGAHAQRVCLVVALGPEERCELAFSRDTYICEQAQRWRSERIQVWRCLVVETRRERLVVETRHRSRERVLVWRTRRMSGLEKSSETHTSAYWSGGV